MFIDREKELRYLEDAYASKRSEFFILFGRRRIGKTELIKRFIQSKKHVYFLAKDQKLALEKERLVERIGEELGIYIKERKNLETIFRELVQKIDPKEKTIIVIDEFPYWLLKERGISSEFQFIWDEILKNKNVFLILTGSFVSVMETEILGKKSPLYGRRTGQIYLEQLPFHALRTFLPSYSFEDIIRVYGITGGVPYYIQEFKNDLNFSKNLQDTVFNKSNILSMEAEILLREELREIHVYFAILRAILEGATKISEIATKSQVDITNIHKYVRVLLGLKFIRKEHPTGEPQKTKNALYVLEDNYMRFWLYYFYPNEDALEEDTNPVVASVKADYNRYIGKYIFEGICKKSISKLTGFRYTQIGRWWFKETEIDLVAINETSNEVLFAECKWQKQEISTIELEKLLKKKNQLSWKKKNRKEYFAFFSRSGFDKGAKEFARANNFKLFDLKDLQTALIE